MKRKVIISLCIATAAFTFVTAALSVSDEQGPSIALSNSGTAVEASEVSKQARAAVASTRAVGEPRLMGVVGGRAFFRLDRAGGESCFALGSVGPSLTLGSIACPDGFPTERVPILDQSTFMEDAAGNVRLLAVEGIAADTVTEVGLIDATGQIHKTPVIRNLYRFGTLPTSTVNAIVAFDRSGAEIYSLDTGR